MATATFSATSERFIIGRNAFAAAGMACTSTSKTLSSSRRRWTPRTHVASMTPATALRFPILTWTFAEQWSSQGEHGRGFDSRYLRAHARTAQRAFTALAVHCAFDVESRPETRNERDDRVGLSSAPAHAEGGRSALWARGAQFSRSAAPCRDGRDLASRARPDVLAFRDLDRADPDRVGDVRGHRGCDHSVAPSGSRVAGERAADRQRCRVRVTGSRHPPRRLVELAWRMDLRSGRGGRRCCRSI